MKHTARAPTTTTELMVISPCAKTSRTNPNSKSRARTDNGVSLSTKTASSRDLHFQRPFRIDRRHATCVQQPRHRVLAAHTKRFRGQELLSGDSPNKYLSRPRVWLCLRLRRPRFGQPEKPTLCKSNISCVAANRWGESQKPSPDAHVTILKLKFRGSA